ncbi:asparagine synthase-related protein [Saccharothrix obliqua]|uniref:asparagine synthase-related protein n=1 Tax=Saccharothrix obliqua TaxID=2861747 RepID=UPI001C5D11A1|nr:asparagine synthase-related protein [Saccharothrix obliqua]MBW4718391.1 asparagine synthase [Saccharothrix obliqua]
MDQPGWDLAGQAWFVILPDDDAAADAIALLPEPTSWVSHPSGRPWLVGRWDPAAVRIGAARGVRLVLVGWTRVSQERVNALAGRVREVADVARVCADLSGCAHVLSSVDGEVVAHGTVSGVRRLFYARVGGVVVAGDRADVLARLAGSGVDERALAMRLVVGEDIVPGLWDPVMWRGVTPVPEDSYLAVDRRGRSRVVRWWWPPEPVLSLREGAWKLRTALIDAVETRRDTGLALSADLSGGLDSTTLCFLASRGDRPLVTFTSKNDDPADEDPLWADRAAARLPATVSRIVLTDDVSPTQYSDLTEFGPVLDEPFPEISVRPVYTERGRLLMARGSRLHLTGDGGDEVLQDSPAYLVDLLRARPLLGARRFTAYWLTRRWPPAHALRYVRPRRDEGAWLVEVADGLTNRLPREEYPRLALHLPPWATTNAVRLAKEYLREIAAVLPPHRGEHTQRQLVRDLRFSGHMARMDQQLFAAMGLSLTAPFFDNTVLNACLAVRPEERTSPWAYKPLLAEAMRGIVPDVSLTRTTKATGFDVDHIAVRQNRASLFALCADSLLADHGLIDPDALRAACSTTMWETMLVPHAMARTFSAERWLRDRPEYATPPIPDATVAGSA